MFDGINQLKKYRKYEEITPELKKELLDLIRVGINPKNFETEDDKKKAEA